MDLGALTAEVVSETGSIRQSKGLSSLVRCVEPIMLSLKNPIALIELRRAIERRQRGFILRQVWEVPNADPV